MGKHCWIKVFGLQKLQRLVVISLLFVFFLFIHPAASGQHFSSGCLSDLLNINTVLGQDPSFYFSSPRAWEAVSAMIANLFGPKFGPSCFLVTAMKVLERPCCSSKFARIFEAAHSPPSLLPTIFIPDGYNRTFAGLPAVIKNQISHRARAIKKLAQFLQSLT